MSVNIAGFRLALTVKLRMTTTIPLDYHLVVSYCLNECSVQSVLKDQSKVTTVGKTAAQQAIFRKYICVSFWNIE